MKTGAALIMVVSLFGLVVGCAGGGGGDDAPSDESDIIKAKCIKVGSQCLPNKMSILPKEGDHASVSEKCFKWNRSRDVSHIDVEDKNAEFDGLFTRISESSETKQDDLSMAQLKLTLKYNDVEGVEKMTVEQLFEAGEDPNFSHWELKGTGLKFTQINIALGDNPMDVVFREGTLEPLIAAHDDNVTFCAPELKGK